MTAAATRSTDDTPTSPRELFVYGTLLPGDVRWHRLEPFVADSGVADTVAGDLFDTGFDYPAAIFDGDTRYQGGLVHGMRFRIVAERYDEALRTLDEVEGVVGGLYHRVRVVTGAGAHVWAYSYGDGLELTPIVSGRWAAQR